MMDAFICEGSQKEREQLKKYCTELYLDRNYEGEIYDFVSGDELAEYLENYSISALYLVDCDELSEFLEEQVNRSSEGNFIILLSDDVQKVLGSISPEVTPSGYIMLPSDGSNVKYLVGQICEKFNKSCEKGTQFHFKIRSRIYSVDIKKINYFEASAKKMVLRAENQEFEYYDNFEHVQSVLPEYFIRSHKSFLVNMKNVKNVDLKEKWISFRDGSVAYISRNYKQDIEDYLENCTL